MLLGVVLHAALAYVGTPWIVVDQAASPWLGWIVPAIHGFRMPLFFLISGFFTAMLWQRRGAKAMLAQRAKRIGLPLLLGMATIVPAMWLTIGLAGSYAKKPERTQEVPPLLKATAVGDTAEVKRLLSEGVDPNQPAPDGTRPIDAGVFLGRVEITRALLDAGATTDHRLPSGIDLRQAAALDRNATMPTVERDKLGVTWEQIQAGREVIRPWLGPEVEPPSAAWMLYQLVTGLPVFHHLWFLWFLCWLVPAFLVVASPLARCGPWLPGLAVLGAGLAQGQMSLAGALPGFGADTAIGLLPVPHVLAYYACFFLVGAWLWLHGRAPKWSTGGLVALVLAAVSLPFALGFGLHVPSTLELVPDPAVRHVVSTVLQALFTWCAIAGLLALGSRLFDKDSPAVRYLSDSAYWVYLVHLPLVVLGQIALTHVPVASEIKLALLLTVLTPLLLASYTLVRNTWVGRLLHGPRETQPPVAGA